MKYRGERDNNKERHYVLLGVMVLIAIVYITRLFYLQIVDTKYRASAKNSSTRTEVVYPDRGLILDRNGEILAFNELAYDLRVTPSKVLPFDTASLLQILDMEKKDFNKRLKKLRRSRYRVSSVFAKQLSAQTYALLQEVMHKFSGFHVQTRTLRKYPKPIAAHMLGYVGEVGRRTIDDNPYYEMGDYAGITGIEKAYEKFLRGEKGKRFFLVDKFNRVIEKYDGGNSDIISQAGANVTTSLDLELQEYGEKLMQGKIGSIVALEPSTGEILALVSSPTFDPNLLVGRQRGKSFRKLANSKLKPLFNRALKAQYPPGSTFKLINGLIGLEEGVIDLTSTYRCQHGYVVGSFRVGCHHGHSMALEEAIQRSCNAYFCHVYRKILDQKEYGGINNAYSQWRNHVLSFGIGKKLGSDLFGELRGNVPPSNYFNKKDGWFNRWKSLWVVSMAIGQGELLVTPFQMANMTASIANRGYYITPHIVKNIEGLDTINRKFVLRNYSSIDPRHFDIVVDGMEKVVTSGTARAASIPDIVVCGKTGTAENPHGKDHSIFAAFAPKENPKIAIAVYVENAGFGSTWAAPIAKLMMEKYLTDTITTKWVEKRMLDGDLIPEIYKENPDSSKILKYRKKKKW